MMKNNMYSLSVKQWSPFVGCEHACVYCVPSFQRNIKRASGKCPHDTQNGETKCYAFEPHFHEERLAQQLPRTRYLQFIFTCANGDIAFATDDQFHKILKVIRKHDDRTFLIQTKDPARAFNRPALRLPRNVLAGITLETNRDMLALCVSQAPPVSQRYRDFLKLQHKTKMVTIEPVLDFDLDVMLDWISNIHPVMVWLGYDSKKCGLPEPSLEKVQQLHWEISLRGGRSSSGISEANAIVIRQYLDDMEVKRGTSIVDQKRQRDVYATEHASVSTRDAPART